MNRHSDSKVERSIINHLATQKVVYQEASEAIYSQQEASLNWNQALGVMLKQNHQVLNAEEALLSTLKRRKDLWIDLIPRAFAYINIRASFDEILKLDSDNLNAGITSNLNIPSPFRFYAEAYALALQEIQQENNLEALKRRLHRDLYVLFLNYQDVTNEYNEQANAVPPENIDQLISFELDRKTRISRYQEVKEKLRVRINKMLDTPNKNWALVGNLPKVNYSRDYAKLSYSNGYGELGLKIQAVNIESGLIALKAGKRVNLPNYSWSITSPTIFDSNREDNFNFSSEEFSLFSGLSKSIEFDDIFNKEKIQNAEYRHQMTQKKLILRVESEVSRLEGLKQRYANSQERKTNLTKLITTINQSRGNSRSNVLISKLEKLQSLKEELKSVEKEIMRMDLEIWIWDEDYWSKN